MRRIGLIILVCLASLVSTAQTYSFSFTTLAGDYARHGAGSEVWNENSGGQTVSGYPAPLDAYRRFTIRDFLNDDGSFNFTKFDSKLHAAMENRQRFSFGVMQQFPWGDGNFNWLSNFSGTDQRTGLSRNGNAAYPLAWHTAMQAAGTKDWIGESGDWVPNSNNATYLSLWSGLHAGINTHLQTGSYQPSWASSPIPYKDVIGYIDIRGHGSWGEWHCYGTAPGNNYQNYPPGTFPTVATFKSIIDGQVNNYQDFRMVIITNALDALRLDNIGVPAEVAAYIYTRTTNKGFVGFRMDHFGDHTGDNELNDDSYDDFQLQKNPSSFAGFQLDTAFDNRFRLAPFYGEPPGGPTSSFGVVQGVFPRQVRKWRVAMVGNGNFGSGNTPTGQAADSVRQGYREAGYHLRLTGGTAVVGSQFTVNLKWRNFGLTPTYDHWDVEYKLKNGAGATVWTSNSSFDPYLFLPEYGEQTKTDVYSMPSVPAGNYAMWVTVKDPTGYMTPLKLQINGRDTDGSYFLSNITIPSGTTNNRPIVNAGANQNITLPDTDAAINATVSDPDGTIASILWTQVSGPAAATFSATNVEDITVSSLVAGVYTFSMLVTDDDGDTQTDEVVITVNEAPNIAPVAAAGNDATITLPLDSILLVGSGTDDVSVTGYSWAFFSGPAGYTIATPTNDSTWITGLVPGTYFFRLTVTDGSLTDTDDVVITVLPAVVPPGTKSRWIWSRKFGPL